MRADTVEVSWDATKSKWAIRIQAGEEVIRRFSSLSKMPRKQLCAPPRKRR